KNHNLRSIKKPASLRSDTRPLSPGIGGRNHPEQAADFPGMRTNAGNHADGLSPCAGMTDAGIFYETIKDDGFVKSPGENFRAQYVVLKY
ncbi:MAG: hypothetical protein PHW17_12925, partial [Desulfobacterales bacterium]|nr:hypothetical protein [Desulfobacterales bacterium]MDD3952029.1 hypothetical protein [Desulfobacterales bacterium]